MKGVPVKFRAKPIIGDEFIFGDFVSRGDECAIRVKENNYLFNLHEYEIAVKPDSVAQLVGYDADGKEVYEDDKLILGSHEYIASIRPVSYTDDKKYYKPEKDSSDFLLKENKKND